MLDVKCFFEHKIGATCLFSVGSDVIQLEFGADIGWLKVTSIEIVSTSVEQEFSPSKWSDKARNESTVERYVI